MLGDRYRIDALLGAGGMGAVLRGWDQRLRQDVAIKENALASPASARQFEREAFMMARLRHANLPRVIDHFVMTGGAQYLVTDYIEGEDLGQMLQRVGPLDEARALAWIEQVCDALVYLHGRQPRSSTGTSRRATSRSRPRGRSSWSILASPRWATPGSRRQWGLWA